jgi:hypothetical protein
MREIALIFCRIVVDEVARFITTHFPDGSSYGAYPHDTDDYRDVARNHGYGFDVMAYAVEHEFAHQLLAQELEGRPCPIIWALAHGLRHPDDTAQREALIMAFQAYLRGFSPMRAAQPGVDWGALRAKALAVLET